MASSNPTTAGSTSLRSANPHGTAPASHRSIDDYSIDPVTAERLQEYAHRRRWLALVRGLCISVFAGGLLLVVGTLIDACWVSNSARRSASLLFYVPLLSVLIWQVILPWIRAIDFAQEASEFGLQFPALSELLSTALQLGQQKQDFGSAAFCDAIQTQTATEMESVEVEQLLPIQRIQNWLRIAGMTLFVLFALSLIPGVYFFERSGRILLPLANLGRISLTHIEITRPLPRSKTLAVGDTILIEARVSGWGTKELGALEIDTGDRNVSKLQLLPTSDADHPSATFSSTFQIEQPQTHYRARDRIRDDALVHAFRCSSAANS